MTLINEKKLIEILYEHAGDLMILQSEIPYYEQQIIESLKNSRRGGGIYRITFGERYVVTIKDAPYAVVVIFDENEMIAGDVKCRLSDGYYIVGRSALIKVERTIIGEKSSAYRISEKEAIKKYFRGRGNPISRIQLIVKKEGNSIYIQNVGKYEVEILPYEVWEEIVKGKLPYDYGKKSSDDKEGKILFVMSILMALLASLLV